MKKALSLLAILFALSNLTFAQEKEDEHEGHENITVPAVVKSSFEKKYPNAAKVLWEKEDGNYEANWGGKSGEDNSGIFTPSGDFVEAGTAMPVSGLPKAIAAYVQQHYKGAKITEAVKVTDAQGKLLYEAEVNGKDIVFDENGKFVKAE